MWTIGVLVAAIFCIPIFWFIFHSCFWSIQPVAASVAKDLGTNTTEWYQVDTMFQFFDNWLAVIGLLVVGVFCYFYSQRRGRPV